MTRYEKAATEMFEEFYDVQELTGKELGKRYGIDPSYALVIRKTLGVTAKEFEECNAQMVRYDVMLEDFEFFKEYYFKHTTD